MMPWRFRFLAAKLRRYNTGLAGKQYPRKVDDVAYQPPEVAKRLLAGYVNAADDDPAVPDGKCERQNSNGKH